MIFDNILKVVAYVLSNSFAEILTILIAMMLGWPAPLLVAQILWIHLICDGPADIMLGFEPKSAQPVQLQAFSFSAMQCGMPAMWIWEEATYLHYLLLTP